MMYYAAALQPATDMSPPIINNNTTALSWKHCKYCVHPGADIMSKLSNVLIDSVDNDEDNSHVNQIEWCEVTQSIYYYTPPPIGSHNV